MARVERATPMARAERRKQLLAVARDIVAAEGLSALTMAYLSERANIAKPVVYTHFADRNAVAIALLEQHFKAIRTFFEARLAAATTLRGYIACVVEAAFAFEDVSDIPIRKITNGFSAGDEVNQVYLRDEAEFRAHWERLLTLLNVPPDKSKVAAPILGGMVGSSVFAFADAAEQTLAKATLTLLLMNALHALTAGDQTDAVDFPDFREPVSSAIAKVYSAERPLGGEDISPTS